MTYHAPTETNPPWTTPPTWPYKTSSADWEPDYRLRLLEAAIIYMWTTGVSTPTGPAGGDLSGTYPNPTVSMGIPAPLAPGSPLSGHTDSLGDVWIAKGGVNGGVWKRPSDALHCRVYQAGAFTFANALQGIVFDTVDRDLYGMYNNGTFTALIAGWYIFNMKIALNFTAAGQSAVLVPFKNGTLYSYAAGLFSQGVAGAHVGPAPLTLFCNAGDTLIWSGDGSSNLAGIPGSSQTYATFDFLGTG